MRSKANLRGHPIHPMIIPFPIAFLLGAFLADAAGLLFDNEDLWLAAWYLSIAGIVTALLAAVPGVIDYRHTVPPRSSAKKRATKHMITMVTVVALFSLSWVLRGGPGVAPDLFIIVVEGVGAALLGVGGWMGGTLSFRNQIGVDHRYAHAGKWREARIDEATAWSRVAAIDELETDQMKLIHVGKNRIVLARSAEGWTAFDDRCPHRGGSLAGGTMACGTVTCPWHGSQFDVTNGRVVAGPSEEGISIYPVEVREDGVYLSPARPMS